jgi:two-component system NtrC family sensor kinase
MSALWSLTGGKQTWGEPSISVAIDPERTLSLDADQNTILCLDRSARLTTVGTDRYRIGRTVVTQSPDVEGMSHDALLALLADRDRELAQAREQLQTKTRDFEESLQQQTASADVLKAISRSTLDLETVLNTLAETVMRLCRADHVYMFRRRGDKNHLVASHGLSQEAKEFVHTHPFAPDRSTLSGRVSLERRVVHIPDVLQDLEYSYEGLKIFDYRTMLGVPLLREDALIGIFVVARTRVQPFTDKEIELATGFADQAVIAIENARLIEQLRDRQAELRVTFDNMGDGVAMFGADTRLVAWNRNFQTILDLPDELVAQRPTYVDFVRLLAERGEFGTDDIEGELSRRLQDTDRELRLERSRPDGRVIEVRRNTVPGGGFVLIYADVTERKHAEQAIRAAHDAAQAALRDLQAAQARLVHAQKMAALGQLTAGIAHEIKNPLNFVNNFADLSVELFDELKEAMAQVIGALDTDKRIEILETIGTLSGNLEKIAEHGRRADGIVRSMLQHSRGSSGDWLATDLNALVEESLKLAYHGARAQDQDFKITLELDLDRNLAPIEVVSQDVSRVLLNLISNGFYAVTKRGLEADPAFRPHLKIATRDFGKGVEIRVRDNGVGIPAESCEKLFQPFFTTKPTGEGTGLGLSISYEIITQQHGGTITVDSEVGEFTQFTVQLPRRRLGLA